MRLGGALHSRDFARRAGLTSPVPWVPGSFEAVGRGSFGPRQVGLPCDLSVTFRMGAWPAGGRCSSYFDPASPWYNTFYGWYVTRSRKPDGTAFGFRADGSPDPSELLALVRADYEVLTAGALGCPPERRCFRVREMSLVRDGEWFAMTARVSIPSGLHRQEDAVRSRWSYYLAFGVPDRALLADDRLSYETVEMLGTLRFQRCDGQTTRAWGVMCPDSPDGRSLWRRIDAEAWPRAKRALAPTPFAP
jgi:hypothetical protein